MKTTSMEIRVHTQSGSTERFVQDDPVLAARILQGLHPAKVFTASRITIAGEYSLTVFATSQITRMDFLHENFAFWEFPTGILDIIELSEEEFRRRAHLNNPALMEKRETHKSPGEFVVGLLDMEMADGGHTFLAVEVMVSLPAERLERLHLLLSAPALHCRLRQGGAAVLNLKNLARFSLYPGPDRAPIDAWPAHHISLDRRAGAPA